MDLYDATVPQFSKMLANLSKWIDKAEEQAKSKSFDVSVLLNDRLAPDMYRFIQQVQSCCDTAKFACARLTGKEPPKHPDTEQTLDEVRARIRSVMGYLETFKPADFAGGEERLVTLAYMQNKKTKGKDYLVEQSLPNFYFHVSMAYAILRHNGVPIGKYDFIGSAKLID